MAEKKEKKEYRLTGSRFYATIEGERKCYSKDDLVPLTETQAIAFKDQFEPKDAKEKAAAAAKKAKARAIADKKEADAAPEKRAEDLEAKKKVEADKAEADRLATEKAATEKAAADKLAAEKAAANPQGGAN